MTTRRAWANTVAGTVGAALLIGLLLFVAVSGQHDRQSALAALRASIANQQQQRAAAVRRIDRLTAQLTQLQQTANSEARQLGELEEQVRSLGGTPVVVTESLPTPHGSSSSASPRPSAASTPRASGRPTPQPTPPPRPTPTSVCPLIICIP